MQFSRNQKVKQLFDNRGRRLNFELGQINQQFDLDGQRAARKLPKLKATFFEKLDRLVDHHDSQGRLNATLYVTREQAHQIALRMWPHGNTAAPTYRNHPVLIHKAEV